MQLLKQQLIALDIASWANLSDEDFLARVEQHQLYNYHSWLLPQLVAHFGTWTILDNGLDTVRHNCKTDHDRSLWRLTRLRRSELIKQQTKYPHYGQLTPLVLLGQRRYVGTNYSWWQNYPGLEWILEPQLLAATSGKVPELPTSRLLAIREQGLVYRTGTRAGTSRNPQSTHQLYGIQDTELANLDKLQQTIILQCWLAHPALRQESMILDTNNWDQIPPALVEQELFLETTLPAEPTTIANQNLPWNQL